MTPEIFEAVHMITLGLTFIVIYLLFRKPRTEKTVLAIVITTILLAILDGIIGNTILAFVWLGCSAMWCVGYEKMRKKRIEKEEKK
jgi:chromate transport protein ChrA